MPFEDYYFINPRQYGFITITTQYIRETMAARIFKVRIFIDFHHRFGLCKLSSSKIRQRFSARRH